MPRLISSAADAASAAAKSASVMSDSVRPHRRQTTRLLRPWDSPGKNTGMGCHFLLQCMKMKSESEVAQLCPTLSDPMDCSLPGSSVHGIFQARVLEWVPTGCPSLQALGCYSFRWFLPGSSHSGKNRVARRIRARSSRCPDAVGGAEPRFAGCCAALQGVCWTFFDWMHFEILQL